MIIINITKDTFGCNGKSLLHTLHHLFHTSSAFKTNITLPCSIFDMSCLCGSMLWSVPYIFDNLYYNIKISDTLQEGKENSSFLNSSFLIYHSGMITDE